MRTEAQIRQPQRAAARQHRIGPALRPWRHTQQQSEGTLMSPDLWLIPMPLALLLYLMWYAEVWDRE